VPLIPGPPVEQPGNDEQQAANMEERQDESERHRRSPHRDRRPQPRQAGTGLAQTKPPQPKTKEEIVRQLAGSQVPATCRGRQAASAARSACPRTARISTSRMTIHPLSAAAGRRRPMRMSTPSKIKAMMGEITAISRKSRDDGNQYWAVFRGRRTIA